MSFCLLPTLLLLSCARLPDVPLPRAAVCQKWNREQLIGYFVLVQLADQERKLGDEAHVAAAVDQLGRMMHLCRILESRDARS